MEPNLAHVKRQIVDKNFLGLKKNTKNQFSTSQIQTKIEATWKKKVETWL